MSVRKQLSVVLLASLMLAGAAADTLAQGRGGPPLTLPGGAPAAVPAAVAIARPSAAEIEAAQRALTRFKESADASTRGDDRALVRSPV